MENRKHRPIRIVKDGRLLRALSNRYLFSWDKEHKYVVNTVGNNCNNMEYKGKKYGLVYFSGCFYPFVAEKYTD